MTTGRSTGTARVAWVESPLQFINTVEYSAATGAALLVIPRAGVSQLDDSIAAVRSWLPDSVAIARAERLPTGLARARSRLIGDVHSGVFRVVVAATGVRDLVIVDDGSATVHAANQLLSDDPSFSRMAQREGVVARWLGRRLRRALVRASATLTLFSAYAAEPPLRELASRGIRVIPNSYAWLRGVDLGTSFPGTVVLGSALSVDRQVPEGLYVDWVASVAAAGAVAYLPHRRESDALLERIGSLPNLVIHRTGLPVEFILGSESGVERVVTLPTSALATLRSVLPPTTTIDLVSVPPTWWSPDHDPAIRTTFDTLERNESPDA